MSLEHKESHLETVVSNEQRKLDLTVLSKEAVFDHLKEKYGQKYWFCVDYLAAHYKKTPDSPKVIFEINKFASIFDEMKSNINNAAFLGQLGLKGNIEASKLVKHAYETGITNPDQIALIALYGLIKISESKAANAEIDPSPVETTYNRHLKMATMPDLITKFEELCR